MSRLPEMLREEFCAHMDDVDFPERYGNPVMAKSEKSLVCMTERHYDCLIWERDRLRDLAELRSRKIEEQNLPDGEIQYWVYKLQMPEKDLARLNQPAAAEGVSLDEYICLTLMAGIRWREGASEWEKMLLRDACKNVDESIRINCSYPVRKGQTEEEAREQAEKAARENI